MMDFRFNSKFADFEIIRKCRGFTLEMKTVTKVWMSSVKITSALQNVQLLVDLMGFA